MRVVAGKYRGRHFDVPRSFKARPTTDFAKENLFNVLRSYVDFEEEAPSALDLFAGTAELLKAGAAPTYLFRDGVFRAFGDRSFPAGILDSAPPDSFSCKLFDGDYIVMTSDGVDLAAVQLLSELSRKNGLSAKEIAAAIGSCVLEKYEKQSRRSKASLPPRDDVSVAVFRIGLRNSGF